jgi:predicted peptidase
MIELKTTKGTRAMAEIPLTVEGEKLPLLVFLHGIGERGTNLSLVLKYGPLKKMADGVDLGIKMIVVHPQLDAGDYQVPWIDEIIEFMKAGYPVDLNRIWLMGISLGGGGVWKYAQSPDNVKKLAAIVPVCGSTNSPDKASVLVNDGIPGWAAHSVTDATVSFSMSTRMVTAVNELAKDEQIHLRQDNLWGHSIWDRFLSPEYGVWNWLKYQTLEKKQQSVRNKQYTDALKQINSITKQVGF